MIKFYEYNYASESACIAHDSHLLVSRRLKPLSESKDQSVADLTVVFSIFRGHPPPPISKPSVTLDLANIVRRLCSGLCHIPHIHAKPPPPPLFRDWWSLLAWMFSYSALALFSGRFPIRSG